MGLTTLDIFQLDLQRKRHGAGLLRLPIDHIVDNRFKEAVFAFGVQGRIELQDAGELGEHQGRVAALCFLNSALDIGLLCV